MAGKNGRDFLIYVGTTAPTDRRATGDAAYGLLGLARNLQISDGRTTIDITTKTDGIDKAILSDLRETSISGTVIYDTTGADAGQAKLHAAVAATDSVVHFLISTDASTDREFYGAAKLTTRNLSLNNSEVGSMDFTLEVTAGLDEGTIT
jgi:hypothetical protein